jgi:multidrug efflux pump subunit AcrB
VVTDMKHMTGPTEIAHYQLRRVIHLYVSPAQENVGHVMQEIKKIVAQTQVPEGTNIDIRGSVESMTSSFRTFGYGLILAILLVYLVLVSQFKSFLDPFLILLAVPTGLTGVLVALWITGTTLNVMSLMGIVMMVGIVVSDSILIVQFVRQLQQDGEDLYTAIITAGRVRLRPILMTSLATLIGLLPMAMKLGTGSEAYAPLARAIIGGLAFSAAFTLFVVPTACLLADRRRKSTPPPAADAADSANAPVAETLVVP